MPECTANIAEAKESVRNTFMGCEGKVVFTFVLSLGSRTDDQSFTIRIRETDGTET